MLTPEELDALSNKMLKPNECTECGERPETFTAMVDHLKSAHPENGDTRSV